jgi:hypothetical protein
MIASYRTDSRPGEPVRDCFWGCPCLSLITNNAEEMRASRGQGGLAGGGWERGSAEVREVAPLLRSHASPSLPMRALARGLLIEGVGDA